MQGSVLKGELKVTIVCSIQDRASQNIKNCLLSIRKWTPAGSENDLAVFEYKEFRIVEIDQPLIYQDGLDKKLSDRGYPASLIIFASKHKSKDMRAIITVHSTGNVNEAKFGGTPQKLAHAAPQAIRSLLRSLKTLTENEEYEVTLECTHHGPSDLEVPSFFVEIGSNEEQWLDEVAGHIVANAIILLKDDESPVAVGFGGTHYAPRQTALTLSNDVTFGHIFPTHALHEIDESMIRQAFARSGADFAYIDRKSMKSEERDNLLRMIEHVGFETLKESEIKEMDGIPWEFCMQLRKRVKEICPSGNPVITEGIKSALSSCKACICPKVKIAKINPSLLCEAQKLDRNRLKTFLSEQNIAYIEYEGGRFSHVLIGLDDSCARLEAQELNNVCIEIIKQNYDVSLDKGKLQIFEQKFSPEMAKSLGIEDEQLYGRLAKGKSVIINGKTINPEMVYETIKRVIKLN